MDMERRDRPDICIVRDTTKGTAMFEDGWAFDAMRDFGPNDTTDENEYNRLTTQTLLAEYELEAEYLNAED
jgi:hypothetical protein